MAPRAGLEHLFQNLRHRHSCLLVPFLTSFSARAVSSWVKAGRNASLNTPFHKSSPLNLRPGLLTTEDRPGRLSQTIRLGASRPLLWNLLSSVCWWLEAGMRLANVRHSPPSCPCFCKGSSFTHTILFTDKKRPVPLVTEVE